ncbi:MAG: hypothetical protein LKE64_09375 [Solobacterium sp.]|jgi:DNA-binding transcriptional regulator YdaS (Cro superfamily)|nr:hypothetical protein [Solobacterium sp.]MCH4048565.1 hypothetical protein [Solobacterium sp.]MCH4074585.1 hypothetical protein [Solobacterium sp.]
MKKSKTPSYIAEYELQPEASGGFAVLHHAENAAVSVYNICLNECLKRMHKVVNDPKYIALCDMYKKNKEQNKKDNADLRAQFSEIFNKYAYTEYAMHAFVSTIRQKYSCLGSAECQKLASRAFRAIDKKRLHKAKRVRFVAHARGTSFEGKSHTSMLHFNRDCLTVSFGRRHEFAIIVPDDDQYLMQCLQDRVKYVRILKRIIRGKERWFTQLVFEGMPPQKDHIFGEGTQGLDEGTSTIASVTDTSVMLAELAPECRPDEKKIRRMQRAMDRSKRAANPDNYHADGTYKKGHHKWKKSKRYLLLQKKLAERKRRQAIYRKQSHCRLANELIARGADIRVEKMNIKGLAKKSKKTAKNKKNGRTQSKKRYGKTIANRAPAMLISIIDQKLHQRGKSILYVNTWTVKASQYNPLDGTYKKKDLKDRMILLGEDSSGNSIIVQRDMLSAYLIQHVSADGTHIDAASAYKDFDNFRTHQNAEVARLRQADQLTWYVS